MYAHLFRFFLYEISSCFFKDKNAFYPQFFLLSTFKYSYVPHRAWCFPNILLIQTEEKLSLVSAMYMFIELKKYVINI